MQWFADWPGTRVAARAGAGLGRALEKGGPGMTYDADIVVAGAGHNSLLTACYLAKAGYRCLVLDARPIPGGGAATEELLLPGFGIDTCATGHTMIRVNPALSRDELGLTADYGLRYAEPDPVEHVAFPDGQQFTMWLDRDRTAEEVARFSKRGRGRLPPPARRVRPGEAHLQPGPVHAGRDSGRRWTRCSPTIPRAGSGPGGGSCPRWRWSGMSSPAVTSRRSCCGWPSRSSSRSTSPAPVCCPTRRPSGASSAAGPVPIGGSGQLTAALTGYLADHGGTVLCGQRVTRLLLEGGRCAGVQTRGRLAVPGGHRGGLDHPRQAPARHGPGGRPGRRNSTTGWTPTTWVCPASPPITPPRRRRSSRPRTARAPPSRPASRAGRRT